MSTCVFCGKSISIPLSLSFIFSFKKLSKPLICESCLNKFEEIDSERSCLGCSRPQNIQTLCSDCQKWKQKYPGLRFTHKALFTYNEIGKEYMKEFKFQGDLVLAELFTKELSQVLKSYQKTHHIVPVPISKKSMEARGFNQVTLLLEKCGIQYKDWLSHTGDGERQATKNRKNRLSTKQFLKVKLDSSEFSQMNKPLLIIDDVYTTGRTIMHANQAFHTFEASTDNIKSKKIIGIESFSLFR